MAKRKRGFTRDKYERWLKEGRGKGEGKEYKPWYTIQDVSGDGKATRIHGRLTDRQHELLSGHELDYFKIAEFAENVKDIREQFPLLPIESTESIADEIGIRHPTDPHTGEHTVVTTDFLITIEEDGKKKFIARTIKEFCDLNNERQIQKFEIERRYWMNMKKDFDWGIVIDQNINKTLANNISIVRPFYSLFGIKGFEYLSDNQINRLVKEFKKIIIGNKVIVREISDSFNDNMVLEAGTGIKIFKHLIITKQIVINMLEPINLDVPIEILNTNSEKLESRNTNG